MNKFIACSLLAVAIRASVSLEEGATGSASCWKNGINRGLGEVPDSCSSGYVSNGLLCESTCSSGYAAEGLFCVESCPSGFTPSGTECMKPSKSRPTGRAWWGYYYKSCGSGWDEFGSLCFKDCPSGWNDHGLSCGTRDTTARALPQPYGCPSDKVQDELGLCYNECPANSDGVFNVCWENCPSGTVPCGDALCLDPSEDCTETILEIA